MLKCLLSSNHFKINTYTRRRIVRENAFRKSPMTVETLGKPPITCTSLRSFRHSIRGWLRRKATNGKGIIYEVFQFSHTIKYRNNKLPIKFWRPSKIRYPVPTYHLIFSLYASLNFLLLFNRLSDSSCSCVWLIDMEIIIKMVIKHCRQTFKKHLYVFRDLSSREIDGRNVVLFGTCFRLQCGYIISVPLVSTSFLLEIHSLSSVHTCTPTHQGGQE